VKSGFNSQSLAPDAVLWNLLPFSLVKTGAESSAGHQLNVLFCVIYEQKKEATTTKYMTEF
jgi:hypothetical protein